MDAPGREADRAAEEGKEDVLMIREPFAYEIDYGRTGEFRQLLGKLWPDIRSFLDRNGIRNFSLHQCGQLVFGYGEKQTEEKLPQGEAEALKGFCDAFLEMGSFLAAPGEGMDLMYHDIGRVREDKELIRLRVFMTRLKSGCRLEYKRRHDGLIAARGETVDPGPDSNFTIGHARGYIFGYDEIDTTMEKDETEEEKAASVAWETAQLGIMDWITNDVDGMSGLHHPNVQRLAWHL